MLNGSSDILMYIIFITIVVYLFFQLFYKKQNTYQPHIRQNITPSNVNHKNTIIQNNTKELPDIIGKNNLSAILVPQQKFYFNNNQYTPNTMTFGSHNSAHNSAIIAAPYV